MLCKMQIYHTWTTATYMSQSGPIKMIDTVHNDIKHLKTDICDFIIELCNCQKINVIKF